MAELLLVTAVIAIGYALSGEKKSDDTPIAKIPTKSMPNGSNLFNSNRVNEILIDEQQMSNKRYDKVFSNKLNGSNLMVPGPMTPYFNKVDYVDNTLPIEFQDNPRLNTTVEYIDPTSEEYSLNHSTGNSVSDSWYGVSLTGEPIDPKSFSHNNMTPFFGSHVRQNVDEYSNNSIVENFTGQAYFDKKKSEQPQLFDPESNITNPYGMSNLSGYQRERYIVSNIRNNVAPTEKIYVGPGLNKGYTWQGSGGFQQADTRDYMLPKTVDELRVKTNPKLTYHVPIIAGSHPSKPGKVGVVQKNRPDSFAVWTPDRYFITTGDRQKPTQRGEVVLKHSNRTTTDIRRSMGPAGPREGFSQEGVRSNVRISEKCQYTPGGPRGIDRAGQWTIPEDCPEKEENNNYVPMKNCNNDGYPLINQMTQPRSKNECSNNRRSMCNSIHDYGKSSISCATTNRQETSCIPNGNITGIDQQGYVPITCDLRPTRKEDIVGNIRWASNIQGLENNMVVWDPNDVPKTTIKETLLQAAPNVNMSAQRPSNPLVYDPNDIPKTTIKETTMSEGILGQIDRQEYLAPLVYDPTDVPRTTNKETTMTDYAGNVYFPNENGRDTNCYDARNTNRQFTSDVQYFGNSAGEQEGGYQVTNIDPKNTNRQFTSDVQYFGNSAGEQDGGYKVVDVEPRYTNRQYTSDNDYTGNAGNTTDKPRNTDCMMDNVVTKSYRETLAQGRIPAREGPKDGVDPGMICATTNKSGDMQNTAYSQRPMMSTKVYNSLPQANNCSDTKNKKTLSNTHIRNRLDSELLAPLKENPYYLGNTSYWTY